MATADLVTRVRARGISAQDLVTKVRARSAIAITVTAPAGGNIEPGDSITLTASASTLPDSWQWTQTDGAQVVLEGAGQTRKFKAPFTLDGTTLVFQIAVTKSGTTALATVTYQVAPHTMWRKVGADIAPSVLTV